MLEKKDLEMIKEIVVEVVDTRIAQSEEKMGARIAQSEEKMGARIDQLEEKTSARIDQLEEKTNARFDQLEEKTSARIDQLEEKFLRALRKAEYALYEEIGRTNVYIMNHVKEVKDELKIISTYYNSVKLDEGNHKLLFNKIVELDDRVTKLEKTG